MEDSERFNQKRYKHWVEDHVRFSDLDPVGHVNNNAVGEYFENARAALFVKITPSWPRGDQLFVLGRMAIDFRRELHLPAKLRVGCGLIKLGRTSVTLANALFRGDDGIAYCESVSVMIDQKTRKPVELSDNVRKLFMEFTG